MKSRTSGTGAQAVTTKGGGGRGRGGGGGGDVMEDRNDATKVLGGNSAGPRPVYTTERYTFKKLTCEVDGVVAQRPGRAMATETVSSVPQEDILNSVMSDACC